MILMIKILNKLIINKCKCEYEKRHRENEKSMQSHKDQDQKDNKYNTDKSRWELRMIRIGFFLFLENYLK